MKTREGASRKAPVGVWTRLVTALILAVVSVASDAWASEGAASPTVGIEGQMEAILPVRGLKAKPLDRQSPIAVRVASEQPHGNAARYDLRYIGAVPGRFDLRSSLLLEDGSPAAGLPELWVEIAGVLPAEHNGSLNLPTSGRMVAFGNYHALIIGGVAIWVLLGIPLFLIGRREAPAPEAPVQRKLTLVERLRPLLESATRGSLAAGEKAQLERMLLAHWRERLGLGTLAPSEAMLRLRADPEGGALLRALEDWLHRPPGTAQVDIEAVLAPYRELPPPVDEPVEAAKRGVL